MCNTAATNKAVTKCECVEEEKNCAVLVLKGLCDCMCI